MIDMRRFLSMAIVLTLTLSAPAWAQTGPASTEKEEKQSSPLIKKAPFILGGIIVFALLYAKVLKPAARRAKKGSQGPNFRVRNDRRLQELADREAAGSEEGVSLAEPSHQEMAQPPPQRQIAPGWYPDPTDAALVRWWDGRSWTDQSQQRSQ